MKLLAVLALLAALAAGGRAARILAVFPSTFTSQVNVYTALTKQLARQGHQVTVLSPFPQKWAPPGYVDIDLMMSPLGAVKNKLANEGPYLFSTDWTKYHKSVLQLWRIGFETTEAIVQSQQMKDLLHNPEGFDLVLVEYFLHEALHGLGHFFKAPLVLFAPSDLPPFDRLPPSYVPNPLLKLQSPMTFYDRVINSLANAFWSVGYSYYYMPKQEALNRELFGNDAPSVWDYKPTVVLINRHPSVSEPRPLDPGVIEVGGLNIRTTPRELSDEVQEFMDGAEDGVIIFSFGGSLQSSMMPQHLKMAFVNAFRKRKERVVWKYENDTIEGLSDNVMLKEWLQQQELLAHPSTKLMITHGGPVSGHEAAHFGVPVVAIPIFGEQLLCAERTHRDHFGVALHVRNVTTNSLLWAIDEALENPRIKEATQRRAAEVRDDEAQPPLERAVHWVEWAMRHPGGGRRHADAGRRLGWWERRGLDVAAVLLGPLLAVPLLRRRRRR